MKTKMGKRNNNQSGFSAIETLLVVVVVIIIGGVAFYVYHTNKKDTPPKQASKHSVNKLHTTDDAVYFTQDTYTDYLAAVKSAGTNPQPGLVGLAAVKNNLTPEFYTKAAASPNGEAFSCDGNLIPERYMSDLASYTLNNAKVAVSIFNSKDLSNIKVIIANVDLTSLKITAVDCPNSASI